MDDTHGTERARLAKRVLEAFKHFPVREEAQADLAFDYDDESEEVKRLLRDREWPDVDYSQLNPHYPCAFLVGKLVLTCYLPAYLLRALTTDPADDDDDFEGLLPDWLIEPGPRGEPPRFKLVIEWLSREQRELLADLFDYWAGDPLEEEDPEFWDSPWVDATLRHAKRLRAAAETLRTNGSQSPTEP